MKENKVPINEMISQIILEMERAGYGVRSIWMVYHPRFRSIQLFHNKKGISYYDPDLTQEFLEIQKERVRNGEVHDSYYRGLRSAGIKMEEFYLTGTIRVVSPLYEKTYIISPANERLIAQFLEWKQYGQNTRDDAEWIVRRYLSYMEKKGYLSVSDISIDDAKEYLLSTASKMKLSSLHNVLLYLKYFYIFLRESNIPAPDCVHLFSYKVYRGTPIQSHVTDEELALILKQIDTDTVSGKRNYAIILLAATTGIRAIDVIRLKLTDIDWRKGEIKIVQSKTGNTVHLPIIREAGDALLDYILNARPKSKCPEVFLRLSPPNVAIMDATSIADMFQKYQKKAGIERMPFDGKGFHGLRRRLAKKLIETGTPLTSIAQILGHSDFRSARQYISLDLSNLKECALDFTGIPYEGRC